VKYKLLVPGAVSDFELETDTLALVGFCTIFTENKNKQNQIDAIRSAKYE
jgi:hypothetical protein